MEFELTESQVMLRRSAQSILSGFGPEYWRKADAEHRFPIEFEAACVKAGLYGLMLPEEYGGAGLGVMDAVVLLRTVGNSPAGLDGCSVLHTGMFGLNPLLVHGTKEQKDEYLPMYARGELPICFGITEPNAGQDVVRITTFARREGSDYVVNGRKVWTSRAQEAKMMLLLCRTKRYEDVKKKTDGLTLLFVPMDQKAIRLREIAKMGRHAVDSNETFIDDLRVPQSCLVGEEDRGFYCLLDGFNPERIMAASEAVGIGFHVIERAAEYARTREAFGRKIGQNQGVQFPLAEAYSLLYAAELVVFDAAWRYDTGKACGAQSNMAKLRAVEAAHFAVNVAFETFGGYGYAKEYDIERFYRQLPIQRIAPVSNNMAKAFIAERVLGLPRSY